ncbi:MAG: hypothetical protein RL462_1641 [Pseudomonadota bacterium]|jgi:hypothetical protein
MPLRGKAAFSAAFVASDFGRLVPIVEPDQTELAGLFYTWFTERCRMRDAQANCVHNHSLEMKPMSHEVPMKYALILAMLCAVNAFANDAPKADDKKPERSVVPEKITRPKSTPDSLPQAVAKGSHPDGCPKFEYKEKPGKIVCLQKATGADKPKPAAH